MIKFLLQELEKSPHPLFCKNELLSRSTEEFQNLYNKKILIYVRPKDGEAERVHSPRCQHGCTLTVVETDVGLEGVCHDHPEEDPISLTKDDLNRYALSVSGLLEEIRTVNGIGGGMQSIGGAYFHFGHKMYGDKRVGFVFTDANVTLVSLTGLRRLCKDDYILIVFAPASVIEDVQLKSSIRPQKVVQTSFAESLDLETYQLLIDELVLAVLDESSEQEGKNRKAKRLKLSPNETERLNEAIVNKVNEFVDLGRGSLLQAFQHVSSVSEAELGHSLTAKGIEGRYNRSKDKYD